jgi:hypothetical protein
MTTLAAGKTGVPGFRKRMALNEKVGGPLQLRKL